MPSAQIRFGRQPTIWFHAYRDRRLQRRLTLRKAGPIRVFLDGKQVVQAWGGDADGVRAKTAHIRLEKGKKVSLKVEYSQRTSGPVGAQLIWAKHDPKPSPEAIAAAKNADVVIAVLGITSELEGEEMPVDEEGFKGGDRTSLDLPKPEEQLLEAVTAAYVL